MPRSAIDTVLAAGHACTHLRDTPLADAPDAAIAQFARENRWALITRDFDFADIRRYPPAEFAGIVVLVLPDTAIAKSITTLVELFLAQPECISHLSGRLAIVEFGRIRLRPAPTIP